jgi:hypothetical protein
VQQDANKHHDSELCTHGVSRVLRTVLTTNNDYFPIQQEPAGVSSAASGLCSNTGWRNFCRRMSHVSLWWGYDGPHQLRLPATLHLILSPSFICTGAARLICGLPHDVVRRFSDIISALICSYTVRVTTLRVLRCLSSFYQLLQLRTMLTITRRANINFKRPRSRRKLYIGGFLIYLTTLFISLDDVLSKKDHLWLTKWKLHARNSSWTNFETLSQYLPEHSEKSHGKPRSKASRSTFEDGNSKIRVRSNDCSNARLGMLNQHVHVKVQLHISSETKTFEEDMKYTTYWALRITLGNIFNALYVCVLKEYISNNRSLLL